VVKILLVIGGMMIGGVIGFYVAIYYVARGMYR
jgi:hypothetical protein